MHVVVGLLPCMLLDDVACLHVERNMLVGASYLDIENYWQYSEILNGLGLIILMYPFNTNFIYLIEDRNTHVFFF